MIYSWKPLAIILIITTKGIYVEIVISSDHEGVFKNYSGVSYHFSYY